MGYLLLCWTVGVIIHFLISGIQESTQTASFDLKSSALKAGLSVVVGAVAAYFAHQANLQHWVVGAIFAAGGFFANYFIKKLSEINL